MANNLKHPVYDVDTHFTIDPITREMSNTASLKTCLIQHDHNSERFTFEIPRLIEGHDMSKCDSVQVHFLNIDAQTKAQSAGVYEVEDLTLDDHNPDRVVGSWLISHNATEYVGSLNFLIRFSCYGTDGYLSYVWNTAIYSGISVSNGIDNGEAILDDYADILNEWRKQTEAFRLMSLEQMVTSTESEGVNVWRATFADGSVALFEVRNGAKGEPGQGASPEELASYIKKTDVPDYETPSFIKVKGDGSGIRIKEGYFSTTPAQTGHIDKRHDSEDYNRVISPELLDYAVKAAVTDNELNLTDDEKAAAANWLGLIKASGTYVGAGESGSLHPNVLSFDFAPSIIIILSGEPASSGFYPTLSILTPNGGYFMNKNSANQLYVEKVSTSFEGKTCKWWASGELSQSNSDIFDKYSYVAI